MIISQRKIRVRVFYSVLVVTLLLTLLSGKLSATETTGNKSYNRTGTKEKPATNTPRYIPKTNPNYSPNTTKPQKPSADTGRYSPAPPAPPSAPVQQQPYTPPQRTTHSYNSSPPSPGAAGCAACITGCFSLLPFAVIVIIFLIIRSVNRKIIRQNISNMMVTQIVTPPRNTDFNQGILFYIKERIPDFNEVAFMDRVNSVFFEIQHAKMKKDLASVRQYLTEGYFNKFKFTINQLAAEHKLLLIKDLFVRKISIIKFKQEDNINAITVRIDASMTEALVDEKNPSKVYSGSLQTPKSISELLIFVKDDSGEITSKVQSSVKCPVCGAPVKPDADNNCEFCGARIMTRTTENEWLLSDIRPVQDSAQT